MKRFFALIFLSLAFSCGKSSLPVPALYEVDVALSYPAGSGVAPHAGVAVRLSGTTLSLEERTNTGGRAVFRVPAGIYKLFVSEKAGGQYFNAGKEVIVRSAGGALSCPVDLSVSRTSPLVIKEFYCGGCPREDSGFYANDKYAILYNNSSAPILLNHVGLAMTYPYPATNTTNYDYVDGVLSYEAAGTAPAGLAFWTFDSDEALVLGPGEQKLVVLAYAIDHTPTFPKSVDLSLPEYYVVYDSEATKNHTAPSERIPTSHYLKVWNYGLTGNWAMDRMSPAFFIFSPESEAALETFFRDGSNVSLYNNKINFPRKMIPRSWLLDGVEVFEKDNVKNKKRLPSHLDLGAAEMIGGLGYTLYRNVDREATEALAENEGKLVYDYDGGTEGSTDPSGIDAESSLRNGARIVYLDTNDSSRDFHLRKKSSLKR